MCHLPWQHGDGNERGGDQVLFALDRFLFQNKRVRAPGQTCFLKFRVHTLTRRPPYRFSRATSARYSQRFQSSRRVPLTKEIMLLCFSLSTRSSKPVFRILHMIYILRPITPPFSDAATTTSRPLPPPPMGRYKPR